MRGGAYAILMAFHHSNTKTLSKDQVCQLAQEYCDEDMEANFHAGRMHGAWSSNETLSKHNLLAKEGNNRHYVAGVGFRSNGPARLTLTRDGEKFVEAMLRKFPPAADPKREQAAVTTAQPMITALAFSGVPPLVAAHTPSRRIKTKLMQDDETALREWIESAFVKQQKTFDVGKDRRLQLHSLCDTLEREIPGLKLHHTSAGSSRSRTLFITVVQKTASQPKFESSPAIKRSFSGTGYKLEASSPGKRIRTASVAAANAALKRAAIYESEISTEASLPARRMLFSPTSDAKGSLESDEKKYLAKAPPAGRRKIFAGASDRETVDLLEDSDDEIPSPSPFAKKNSAFYDLLADSDEKRLGKKFIRQKEDKEILDLCCDEPLSENPAQKKPPTEVISLDSDDDEVQRENIISLDSDDDEVQRENIILLDSDNDEEQKPQPKCLVNPYKKKNLPSNNKSSLIFCIDDRERIRNAAPRRLRTELMRLLETGSLQAMWPESMQDATVDEVQLRFGDFSFLVGEKRLDVVVERKQIRDLVQRSTRGDHWKQLGKMRDNFRHSVFLIEVDPRQAARFDAHGSQNLDSWNPYNTVIDDERSFYLFMCRALLSHRSVKFIQTREFQSSLRAVGALGLMAAALEITMEEDSEKHTRPVDEQARLMKRLTKAALPHPLADHVAKECGSVKHLESIYQECVDEDCKASLLLPLVQNTDMEGIAEGDESSWSEAIFRSLYSVHSDTSLAASSYQNFQQLVEDQGELLCALHKDTDTNAALDSVLSTSKKVENQTRRYVSIVLCQDQANLFPAPTSESFYSITTSASQPFGASIPTLVFRTSSGALSSSEVIVHVISGTFFVNEVKLVMIRMGSEHVKAARVAGASILKASKIVGVNTTKSRRILIIRGLPSAIEAEAKKAGYRTELKTVLDLVTADLMLEHDVVVLQALRQKGDVELILQQLALACFHYQLLTEKTPSY